MAEKEIKASSRDNLFAGVMYLYSRNANCEPVKALDYYRSLLAKPDCLFSECDVANVFTQEGELKIRRSLQKDIRMSPEDLMLSLNEQLASLGKLEDSILSESLETGFASHSIEHTDRVMIRMLDVASRMIPGLTTVDSETGVRKFNTGSEEVRKLINRMIIEAKLHDAKMILGRAVNDLTCEGMLKKIYPDWETQTTDFVQIRKAIDLHSEGVALRTPLSAFSTEALLLCLADKLDMVDDRLPKTAFPHGIDKDFHTRAQFFLSKVPEISFNQRSNGENSVTVDIHFSRQDRSGKFQDMWLKRNSRRKNSGCKRDKKDDIKKVVPEAWHEARVKRNTFYSSQYWAETITDTYTNRFALIGLCLLQISRNENSFGKGIPLRGIQYMVHDKDTSTVIGTEYLTFVGGEDNFYQFFLFFNYLNEATKNATRKSFKDGHVPEFPPILKPRDNLLGAIKRYDWDLKVSDSRKRERNIAGFVLNGKVTNLDYFNEQLGLTDNFF